MIKTLFFCEYCRKHLLDVNEIHFVEDQSDRGFCSEKCILEFYRPYMLAFEDEESQFRSSLRLPPEESHSDVLASDHYLQLALKNPSEVWQIENDLNQRFYTHILEFSLNGEVYYMILICSYIDGAPSFVF
jgi:YHS domain-containing protein